jgi:hypothetical protein
MPTSKSELIAALEASRDDLLAKVRPMPEEAFSQGRYENGWNAKQILAHVASIEWTYPKLIEVAHAAAGGTAADTTAERAERAKSEDEGHLHVRRTTDEESKGVPTRPAEGGILNYNDRQVAKREDASVAELISEFEKNRAATIAAVQAIDDALFDVTIRSAGGITGPLGDVIRAVAVGHIQMHAADIAGVEWKGPRF